MNVSLGTPEIAQLDADLWVVRMPLPMRVEPVNCYVGRQPDGRLVIIDTGIDVGAREAWSSVLDTLDAAAQDVAAIVITHFHPDHIGASSTLADLTGAPVYASAITVAQTPGVWGPGLDDYLQRMEAHLARNGMPAARIAEFEHESLLARAAVVVPDVIRPLVEDEPLEFGGATWTIIPTPGHADGHICLHAAEQGWLMAGDHLLERISPAVGKFPDHAVNPLGNYLSSLDRLDELEIELVFPGHGKPFTGAHARGVALKQHHSDRLEACLDAIDAGAASTWDVAQRVFGTHHDAMNERFTVTESLAHLALAQEQGRVDIVDIEADVWTWHLLAGDRLVP